MKAQVPQVFKQHWVTCLGIFLALVIVIVKQWPEITGWAKLSPGLDAQRMLVMIQEMQYSGFLTRSYLFDLDRTSAMGPYSSGFQFLIVVLSSVTELNAGIFVVAAQMVFILLACLIAIIICRDMYTNILISGLALVLIAVSLTQIHPTPHYFATLVLVPFLLFSVNKGVLESSKAFIFLAGIIFATLVIVHSTIATIVLALLLVFFLTIFFFYDNPGKKTILYLSIAMVGFYLWRFILWIAQYNYTDLGDALYSYTSIWGLRVSKELSLIFFLLFWSIPMLMMGFFTYYELLPWVVRLTRSARQIGRQIGQQLTSARFNIMLLLAFVITVGFTSLLFVPIPLLQQVIDDHIFREQTFSQYMFTPTLLLLSLVPLAWIEGLKAKEILFAMLLIPLLGAVALSALGRLPPEGPIESFMDLGYLFVIVFGAKALARCIELARELRRWWLWILPVVIFALILPISRYGLHQTNSEMEAVRASIWLHRQISTEGSPARVGTNSKYIRSFIYISPQDIFIPWEGSQADDIMNFACIHELDYLILLKPDVQWIDRLAQNAQFTQVYNRDRVAIYSQTAIGGCNFPYQ